MTPDRARSELEQALAGQFRLVRHLGSGGMGAVYEAFDLERERACALKVFTATGFGGRGRVRFKREFRTAARLHHPACIRVFALGENARFAWFTQELLPLGSLAKRLAKRPLSVTEAVRVGCQVAAALDHVHGHDIVHRDLKPSNILLADDDMKAIRLSDFGIAQVSGLEEELASTEILGSSRYLAPEVVEHGTSDPRADIYALGVILYEGLTGKHPTGPAGGAKSVDWLHALSSVEPVPLRDLAPHVPEALETAVMRMLAKRPADRHRTAAEILAELASCSGDPSAALPPLVARPYLAATPLVGRDAQLQKAMAVVDAALTRPGQQPPLLLSITGGPGCGKSRLLQNVVRQLRTRRYTVLHAECRREALLAYREIRHILTQLAQEAGEGVAQDETLRSVATASGVQTPSAAPPAPASFSGDPRDELQRLLARATNLLCALSEQRPIAIVIEDLQWIEVASLQALTAMVRAMVAARRRGKHLAVAFVVTHRPADLAPLYEAAAELGTLETLVLDALEGAAVSELVKTLLGVPAAEDCEHFARAVFGGRATPLFVKQIMQIALARGLLWPRDVPWAGAWQLGLAAHSYSELPSTLQAAIGDRAARLSVETQRMLAMAAVGGRRFDVGVLQRALGEDEALVLDCLDEAARAGFVLACGRDERFMFAHDRYREAIYEHLSAAQRRAFHGAWAEALVRSVDLGALGRLAPELAHHYSASGDPARAHEHALIAGETALKANAFHQAANMYELAQSSAAAAGVPFASLLRERQGDACMNAGRYEQAAACYGDRLSSCASHERPGLLVKLAELKHRGAKERALAPESVLSSLEQAMQELGFAPPRSDLGLQLATLGNLFILGVLIARPGLVRTTPRPDAAQLHALCSICLLASEVAFFYSPSRLAYYGLKAATLAARLGPAGVSMIAMSSAGVGAARLGFGSAARRLEGLSRHLEPETPSALERAHAGLLRGISAYARGDLGAAEAFLREGHLAVERSPEPLRRGLVMTVLGILLAHRGKLAQADATGQRMITQGEIESMSYLRFGGHNVRGVSAFLARDYSRALDEHMACFDVEEAKADDFTRMTTELQRRTYALLVDPSADLPSHLAAVRAYQRRGFVSLNVSFVNHSLFAILLSAIDRNALTPQLLQGLTRAHAREWRNARVSFVQQRPLHVGLEAAIAFARGRRATSARLFRRARADARRIGVLGEVPLIELLAAAAH